MKDDFKEGLLAGLPVCLGYISVSFAFGMMVSQAGMPIGMGVLMSLTNVTSAGQFAGLNLILAQAPYVEIAMTSLVINLRYALMSLSLTQNLEEKMDRWTRALISFGITDELFAIAVTSTKKVNGAYFAGLFITPYLGWALGTYLGATVSSILPQAMSSAMNVALYGMFIAIIVPNAQENKAMGLAVVLAVAMSCLFAWTPLNQLGSGWTIIVITVLVSGFMAVFFPLEEKEAEHGKSHH